MGIKKFLKLYHETKKSVFFVYFTLRFLVLLCIFLQIINHNWNNVVYCFFALILFTLPFFISKNFKIEIPNLLEIIILIFIFSAMILGEVNHFYLTIPHFDKMLHTINGFICCAIGFSLVELLNDNVKTFNLTPFFRVVVAFCFSMTVGVLWEFFEFGADVCFKSDMQKDTILKTVKSVTVSDTKDVVVLDDIESVEITYGNNQKMIVKNGYLDIGLYDTMKDLIVNFIGALIFSVLGYIYLNNKDKCKITKELLITKSD